MRKKRTPRTAEAPSERIARELNQFLKDLEDLRRDVLEAVVKVKSATGDNKVELTNLARKQAQEGVYILQRLGR